MRALDLHSGRQRWTIGAKEFEKDQDTTLGVAAGGDGVAVFRQVDLVKRGGLVSVFAANDGANLGNAVPER